MIIVDNDIRAVIFDLDGTLYSRKGLIINVTLKMTLKRWRNLWLLRAMSKSRNSQKGQDYYDKDKLYNQLFNNIANIANVTKSEARDWYLKEFYPSFIETLSKKYEMYPSVNDLMKHLNSQGIKLAVLSDHSYLPERLNALGIDTDFFEMIISAEELGAYKPAKRLFLSVAEELKVKPENVLVLGDKADTDGEGAKAANMKYIQIVDNKSRRNGSNVFTWQDFSHLIFESENN